MRIRVSDAPRASDDRVLAMLSARKAGAKWAAIGAAHGCTAGAASNLCRNVRRDDEVTEGRDLSAFYR